MVKIVREPLEWARGAIQRLLRDIDAESIRTFQTMYYVLIIAAGLYLLLAASGPPQTIEETLGNPEYKIWLTANIVCPLMTLVGRRVYRLAAAVPPGEPNSARGGAWLQIAGDGGVWAAICIYVLCVFNTSEWGQGLYAVFFVIMGIPGGAMFTLRSVRRVREIKKHDRRLKRIEDG